MLILSLLLGLMFAAGGLSASAGHVSGSLAAVSAASADLSSAGNGCWMGFRPASRPSLEIGALSPLNPQDEKAILELLKARDRQIKALLGPEGSEPTAGQRRDLKVIVNGIIDFGMMAQGALGAAYDSVSTAEREEFTELFASIIRDQSLNKLDIYRAEVRYDSVRVRGNDAWVATTASYKNVRTPVSYAMKRAGTSWVITDMVIDDVSTVESYQRQFQSIIRRRGFDALMTSLRKRAERNEGSVSSGPADPGPSAPPRLDAAPGPSAPPRLDAAPGPSSPPHPSADPGL